MELLLGRVKLNPDADPPVDVLNTEGADVAAGLPNSPPPPEGAEVVVVFCAGASGVVEDTVSSVGEVTVFPEKKYSLCTRQGFIYTLLSDALLGNSVSHDVLFTLSGGKDLNKFLFWCSV